MTATKRVARPRSANVTRIFAFFCIPPKTLSTARAQTPNRPSHGRCRRANILPLRHHPDVSVSPVTRPALLRGGVGTTVTATHCHCNLLALPWGELPHQNRVREPRVCRWCARRVSPCHAAAACCGLLLSLLLLLLLLLSVAAPSPTHHALWLSHAEHRLPRQLHAPGYLNRNKPRLLSALYQCLHALQSAE